MLKIIHNAMNTEEKELKLWARQWVAKQKEKGRKEVKKQKPRA